MKKFLDIKKKRNQIKSCDDYYDTDFEEEAFCENCGETEDLRPLDVWGSDEYICADCADEEDDCCPECGCDCSY